MHDRADGNGLHIIRFVAELGVDVRVHGQGRHGRQRQHRAIGGRAFECLHRNAAACAGLVFHKAWVLAVGRAAQLFGHAAGHAVARTTGGKAIHDLDLFQRLRETGQGIKRTERCGRAEGLYKVASSGRHGCLLVVLWCQ
ncbi:hypothetical protein D3C72_1916650 [compost metagenome]